MLNRHELLHLWLICDVSLISSPVMTLNRLTIYHIERALTGQLVVNCFADFIAKDHPKPVVIVLGKGPVY